MAHDLAVCFDVLDHTSSRLGQTAGDLSFSPADHQAPPHPAFVGDIESVATGVQTTSSMFSDTDSIVADGATTLIRGA